jgi:hypothetical protein
MDALMLAEPHLTSHNGHSQSCYPTATIVVHLLLFICCRHTSLARQYGHVIQHLSCGLHDVARSCMTHCNVPAHQTYLAGEQHCWQQQLHRATLWQQQRLHQA